jgi:PPK2 family polyphosphate:nucleotide phosphotransferase
MNHQPSPFERFRVSPKGKVQLKDFATDDTTSFDKAQGQQHLIDCREQIAALQSKLYAQNTSGLLVLLQGIDASGKDSTIKHVMTGVNPAGVRVTSFKVPSTQELDHDYLWRYVIALPERGMIGVFNRSQYEEVLVVRVHPELLGRQHLHSSKKTDDIWQRRYREINHFEEYLCNNGFQVLKCFMHISKEEQRKRFLARIDDPDKNWKFSEGDVRERSFWDDYRKAFEEMLEHTSTEHAPWYVVPADQKWFARAVVADLIKSKLAEMKPEYPQLDEAAKEGLKRAAALLHEEK